MDLPRNTLNFLGLAAEYCSALERAPQTERDAFVDDMLRLLPRIYITASDLEVPIAPEDYEPPATYLDADGYESIRNGILSVMGEEDTFLETFEQDMKYSDTPIGASISESLADIYQPLINCALAVRDSEGALAPEAINEVHNAFTEYWAQTLCNVLRPLNAIKFQ